MQHIRSGNITVLFHRRVISFRPALRTEIDAGARPGKIGRLP